METVPTKLHFNRKSAVKSSYRAHFIDIKSCLRKVANEEYENYDCEDRGHGVVTPVGVAGLEAVVQCSGSSYCSIDQPI